MSTFASLTSFLAFNIHVVFSITRTIITYVIKILCFLMLLVAVHGVTKNILDFNVFVQSSLKSNWNPKLMSLKNSGR